MCEASLLCYFQCLVCARLCEGVLCGDERSMRFLYRYYGCLDYALDAITNRRLYFSAPGDFKDPFDCRPKFSLFFCKREPEEIWKRYFFLLAMEQHPGISDDEARKHAAAEILKGRHRDMLWLHEADEKIKKSVAEHVSTLKICCFSKSSRNAMMWAHYANNHKGLVLQFKKSAMLDDGGSIKGFEVDYYRQPIPLRRYVESMEATKDGDNTAFARLILCSKSYEWETEEELRFFSRKRYVPYSETMLTGILFGSECSVHWEDHIYTALSTWASKPKFFREDSSISSMKLCFRLA
jgi:hypothetical protein